MMDIPGVSLLLYEALHILLLGFIKNHMEDSLNFLILPKFPRKTVTGALLMRQYRPNRTVVNPAYEQLSKSFFSQSRKFLISRGLVLGGIKWNRSS